MKKILSVVLVALMIFSMASGVFAMVPSYDEDPTRYDFDQHVTMTVGNAEITQGTTTATVSVDMSGVPTNGLPDEGGVCAVEFWAIFDKKLSYSGIDLSTGMFTGDAATTPMVDEYLSRKAKWTNAETGVVSEYFLNTVNELWDIHGTTEEQVLATKNVYWFFIAPDNIDSVHLGDGHICDLEFTVPADIPVGEYEITVWTYCDGITGGSYEDFEENEWAATIDDTPGSIKVNAAPAVTPTLKMSDAAVTVGDAEATFTITMENNPGFWALKAYIIYPDTLSVVQDSLTKGENFGIVTNFTTEANKPMRDISFADAKASTINFDLEEECAAKGIDGTGKNVARLQMDLSSEDEMLNNTDNGIVVTFKFNTATIEAGEYDIDLVLSGYNTINCDSDNVSIDTVSGKLKVETCDHAWALKSSTPATCTEASTEISECSKCGGTKTEHATAALGHEFKEAISTTDPTCTSKGYTTYQCSRCTETEKRDYTDEIDHVWDLTSSTDANCTDASTENYECSMCHGTKTEHATAALGHDFSVKGSTVDPTCTSKGYTTYQCSRCTETENRDYTDEVDHDWTETGRTDATCTSAEKISWKCSYECGATKTTDGEAALGHDITSKVTTVAPTCTADGYTTYKCTRCDVTENRDKVDALGHDITSKVTTVDPTCTAEGYTTYKCTRCDVTENRDKVDALGHDITSKVTTVDPTCTAEGYTTYKCVRCDVTENRDKVDALGHDFEEGTKVDPTCTTEGYTPFECSRCHVVEKRDVVDALGHDWDAGVVTKAPTTTEEGEKTFTCRRCNATRTEPIDKLEAPADGSNAGTDGGANGSAQTGDAFITIAIVAAVALIALAGTVVIKKKVSDK